MTDTAISEQQAYVSMTQEQMERERQAYEQRKKGKMRSQKTRKIISQVVIYAILVLYAAIIIFPFLVVLITSLKTYQDATHIPFEWVPSMGFTGDNYVEVFTYSPQMNAAMSSIIQGFLNTLMYIIPPTLIGLFTSSISAYAFSKLRFRAKNWMYSVLLGTMLIPGMITLAPQLSLYDMIGWIDTPLPLMIPGMFGAAACVFFMRQYYVGIPDSIIEAAKIDGLGFLGIFFQIMVPLSVPALLAQGLLGFIGGYNDFMGPLLYLGPANLQTLQLALRTLASTYGDDPNVIMAACIVALVPMLIVYFVCQKFFINGIIAGGLKD